MEKTIVDFYQSVTSQAIDDFDRFRDQLVIQRLFGVELTEEEAHEYYALKLRLYCTSRMLAYVAMLYSTTEEQYAKARRVWDETNKPETLAEITQIEKALVK